MSEEIANQPFSFDERAQEHVAVGATVAAEDASDRSLEIDSALAAAGIAAYRWTVDDDVIRWSANAAAVLGRDPAAVATGKSFAMLLDPDNLASRYDAVMRVNHGDGGNGTPFEVEYLFRPDGRGCTASIWIEDHGRSFAGPDGRPREVLGTVRRITDRRNRDQHLSFLGSCDPLTGMMNRGRMAEALGEAMTVAERNGTSCSLVLAAINNLGVVNDAYGFEIADEVIVSMGRRLRQAVRAGDAIARYSGSKFGMILNNCDEEALEGAIMRFVDMARESVIETNKGPVWALLSIGGITLPEQASDPVTAMARAEEALSEARRLPSDGHVIYRPSHERDWKRRQNAMHASEIVRCLREDRFLLAFQPVVRRENSATPAYYEALLRIRNASGAIIMAGDLIPVAEQLGLVRLIDRAVVQMAITTLNRYPDAKLAINISGTTAIDPRWSPQITALLAANRGITDRIIIEITETVALSDIQATRLFAEQLRDLGCSVAIDDFGAGFTSFRDLKVLPVDVLKIDGNFCRDLANNSENQYFVRALIDLARAFNFKTVAEWVENEADAALLREWQVDFLQGNLFGAASLDPPWIAAAEEPPIDLTAGELPGGEMDWLPPGERSDHQPAQADADEPAVTAATSEAVPEAAAEIPDMAPEPAIAAFEQELSQELSKLRQAIAALDASFNRRPPPPVSGEPSYADLVSDTVLARAG